MEINRGIWITTDIEIYNKWKSQNDQLLLCYFGNVPHYLLFPYCAFAVNHGGI